MSYPFPRALRGRGRGVPGEPRQLDLFEDLLAGGAEPSPADITPYGSAMPLARNLQHPVEGASAGGEPWHDASADPVQPLGAAAERVLAFRRSPDLSASAAATHAVTLGAWGEALVLARLHSWGYDASTLGPGARFDVLAHVPPLVPSPCAEPLDGALSRPGLSRVARVQVKATLGRPGGSRRFRLRRGYRNTGQGTRPYEAGDFDLVALVCLREEVVLFSSARTGEISLEEGFVRRMAPHQRETFEAALLEVGALTPEEYDLLISSPDSQLGISPGL